MEQIGTKGNEKWHGTWMRRELDKLTQEDVVLMGIMLVSLIPPFASAVQTQQHSSPYNMTMVKA